MQQRELISGFSELKDLLIRTYNIKKEYEFVRLYFSESDNKLFMHDYDDHRKVISLCANIERKLIVEQLNAKAYRLVQESLKHTSPALYLVNEFQLSGFFRL